MALVAISALPASTTIVTSDVLPAVVGGTTKKITAGNFRTQLFAFAATDPLNCGILTAVGNSTITGTLSGVTTLTASSFACSSAVGKLVPGATSFAFRNNADSADNLQVTDAGAVAVRGTLAVTAGVLTLSAAVSKIIPGATSLSLRNTADTANNLILTDAGAATFRSSLAGVTTLNTSGLITAGGGVNIAGGSFAAGTIYQSAGTGLTLACLAGSGYDFQLINPAGSVGIIRVPTGTSTVLLAGSLQFSAANTKIIPGATNISFRNTADGADNVVVADAGDVTISRGRLLMSTATSKIVPGATALAFRNNADSANNLNITDAGIITTRGGFAITSGGQVSLVAGTTGQASLNMPGGAAPTSPVDGDMWYDGTNVKFRVGITTKTFTLT
jgi:hypothetical protein